MSNDDQYRNAKIILVIGPAGAGKTSLLRLLTGQDLNIGHTLDHGTALPTQIPTNINGQDYLFIDSPGFGHADSKPGVIKNQIHAMLGFFTRDLGGIHGILYVQDITVDRNVPGMQEATNFLKELTGPPIRPQITFITTKWDIPRAVPKLWEKCETKEARLIDTTWSEFKVGDIGGSRHFRHGVDVSEDTPEEKENGRVELLNGVMAHYTQASVEELVMPFRQWTYMQQGFKIATVTGKVIVVGVTAVATGYLALAFVAAVAAGEVIVSVGIEVRG